MERSMCGMLMRLPLFQGMSHGELFEILEQVVFHFHKAGDGEVVFRQGDLCDRLTFLMGGQLMSETEAPRAELSLSEVFAPYVVIEPQSLFGKRPCYKATYTAQGEVSLLSIDKRYIYSLLGSYEIFRINLLNLLGSKVENLYEQLWAVGPQALEGRLAQLIGSLCTTPQGYKVLRVKMEELARLMDDTRLNVSRILNKWQDEELVTLRRKEFVIHDLRKLLDIASR